MHLEAGYNFIGVYCITVTTHFEKITHFEKKFQSGLNLGPA